MSFYKWNNNTDEMQVRLNAKNVAVFFIGLFFLYLIYILWGRGDSLPELWVELPELINYCVLAVESGGYAVKKIHMEKQLNAKSKGETKEGAAQFVTRADLISNHIIMDAFSRFPGVKVVSEEKESLTDDQVKPYKQSNYDVWLTYKDMLKGLPKERVALSELSIWVDPLDATQEYTEDLVEYVTVMVCIALRGRPKFGIIYRPFFNETIWGYVDHGVYWSDRDLNKNRSEPIKRIVVSRSHAGEVKEIALKSFGSYKVEPAGGAGYKSLRVLNGTAAMYIHKTAIKKWDVCAGDAIIRAAGGHMLTLKGNEITYFPDDDFVNTNGLLVSLKNTFSHLAKIQKHL